MSNQEVREQREISFWETDIHHKPGADSLENMLNKFREAPRFHKLLREHHDYFQGSGRILELGAGQGWASCIVKRAFPDKFVAATDIAAAAIASVPLWETVFNVKLDQTAACKSYEVPFEDGSFDLIFAFASAHHFGRHRATLKEIRRLLSPKGVALYLSEPGCRGYIHTWARDRINSKRPEVAEDILVYKIIQKIGQELGLSVDVRFGERSLENVSFLGAICHFAQMKLSFLHDILPCPINIVIRKI